MSDLTIATKADPALVLPSLLIASYLEQSATLPVLTKSFHEGAALAGKESIQLTFDDGQTLSNKAIVYYFADLANNNTTPQRASLVSGLPRDYSIPVLIGVV
jgi:glutamyl-tRNA synthetase